MWDSGARMQNSEVWFFKRQRDYAHTHAHTQVKWSREEVACQWITPWWFNCASRLENSCRAGSVHACTRTRHKPRTGALHVSAGEPISAESQLSAKPAAVCWVFFLFLASLPASLKRRLLCETLDFPPFRPRSPAISCLSPLPAPPVGHESAQLPPPPLPSCLTRSARLAFSLKAVTRGIAAALPTISKSKYGSRSERRPGRPFEVEVLGVAYAGKEGWQSERGRGVRVKREPDEGSCCALVCLHTSESLPLAGAPQSLLSWTPSVCIHGDPLLHRDPFHLIWGRPQKHTPRWIIRITVPCPSRPPRTPSLGQTIITGKHESWTLPLVIFAKLSVLHLHRKCQPWPSLGSLLRHWHEMRHKYPAGENKRCAAEIKRRTKCEITDRGHRYSDQYRNFPSFSASLNRYKLADAACDCATGPRPLSVTVPFREH